MDKINLLRTIMKEEQIDAYLVPTSDFHGSEYVGEAFKVREYLSGFTGSAGTLLVTMEEAGLWTDGRYFIQAEQELSGSGIRLFRMQEEGVPTIRDYLQSVMKPGQILAFDGRCISIDQGLKYEAQMREMKAGIVYDRDMTGHIWSDRPNLPCEPIYDLPSLWSGCPATEKIETIRAKIKEEKAEALVLTKLDDLMWLFNIRGSDIPCNPVALSYGYVDEQEVILFIREPALTEKTRRVLEGDGITVRSYESFYGYVAELRDRVVLLDRERCNYTIYRSLESHNRIVLGDNPTELCKAVKNEVELEHTREACRRDSAAVIRFMKWIKEQTADRPVSEIEAGTYLDRLRGEIEGFTDVSFPTICAWGANAAMMHYEAKDGECALIGTNGLLLVDSGGQYMGGTTDVTRTIVLGEISLEIRRQYTAVVQGMFSLSRAVFLKGCTGRNLDILAREALWRMGIDYKCGTGHGIGYMLNVHEGPQNIRWSYRKELAEAVLQPGMIVSDEPGVYKEGSHGIRIENMLAVQEERRTDDGQFLSFETLTPVPIDLDGLMVTEMSIAEIRHLNEYHRWVYDTMKRYLSQEEKEWLANATRPV